MIDPDAVLGVLLALVTDLERKDGPITDLRAYRDRIVKLAEDVGICGHVSPWHRAVQCDLDDGHRGLHSGLTWEGPADAIIAPLRIHWPREEIG